MNQISIYAELEALLDFAQAKLMLHQRDRLLARHRLYLFLGLEGVTEAEETVSLNIKQDVYQQTANIVSWAEQQQKYSSESSIEADLFLANLLGQLTPLPSQLEQHFWQLYQQGPEQATAFFYQLSQDSAYIRNDRLAQNFSWKTNSVYGPMEITINLSKPEKDPKAIAAEAIAAQTHKGENYPQCVLCFENEGYPGHRRWAARFNHRMLELQLNGKDFALQYSPYLYYPEHSILLSKEHKPMAIDGATFAELFDFVRQFPHYMVGSNADLPIVGGSILGHHHFQAGCHEFPMFRVSALDYSTKQNWCAFPGDIHLELLQWPLSVLKLSGNDTATLCHIGEQVLACWREYSDESIGLMAHSNDGPHNTITPILRQQQGLYEFYLVLRNNRCSVEHPLGIYHPHAEIHHIKKENIGLIEVMGLAILPGRLKAEMQLAEAYLQALPQSTARRQLHSEPALQQHLAWLEELQAPAEPQKLSEYIRMQIAEVFAAGLKHCGVLNNEASWQNFLRSCNLIAKV